MTQTIRTSARRSPFLASLAMIAALAPAVAVADVVTVEAMFAANGRSIWTDGPGFSENFNRFLGPDPFNVNAPHLGEVIKKCLFGFCAEFGAEIGARASGSAGIPYGLKVDSGTFDVHYPVRALFDVPTSVLGGPGNPLVTIGTSFGGVAGGLSLPDSAGGARGATLQVRTPDIQAYVDLSAELHAFAGARVCVGACYNATPSFGPFDFSGSKEIAALNRNGDGEIRVLGNTVSSHQSISALGGLLNANFNLPHLDSSSAATPGGFDGFNLVSSRRDSVAAVNANLAQIVLDAVGLGIPLSGNFGPFGYNLLQANAGAYIDVQETLTFTPTATARLMFSSDVIPNIGGVDQAPTRVMDFRLGDPVMFTPTGVGAIGIEPIITLGGHVTNRLDLVLGGHMDIQALGLNIFGLTAGPLVNEHLASNNLGTINLLDLDFDMGLGTVVGSPFTLGFPGCVASLGPREFPRPGVCGLSAFAPGGTFGSANGSQMDELVKINCDSFDPFDTTDSPNCRFSSTGMFTSPYFENGSIDTFIGGDAFSFDRVSPGASTTDESQIRLLASLAGAGGTQFLIPTGAPFPTPEPGTGALLGLAFVGLIAMRGSRSSRPRREGPG